MTEPVPSAATAPILVAINAARRCADTLGMAVALAASIGAELEVVFVEDEDLLRLADLPVTREVDRISGIAREMSSQSIVRALRCEVAQLRREIERLAKPSSLRSTVRVVRGRYLTEALSASAGVDVAFVHGNRRALAGERLPARPTRADAASRAPATAKRPGAAMPLWTLFEGSAASTRALKVALMLARTLGGTLVVLLCGRNADEIENRKHQAQAAAEGSDLRFLAVPENWFTQPAWAVPGAAGGLLVLARETSGPEGSAVRRYIESLAAPVVLVS